MKNIMMDTAQVTCGLSKSPCRHKEIRWWNEEAAEAVREKKKKYGNWKKKKNQQAWMEYKKSKQNIKRVISLAKGKKQKEYASRLDSYACRVVAFHLGGSSSVLLFILLSCFCVIFSLQLNTHNMPNYTQVFKTCTAGFSNQIQSRHATSQSRFFLNF